MASVAIQSAQWRRHGNSQFEEGFGADKPMLGWSGSSGNEAMQQSQAQVGEVPAGGSPVESHITALALSTLPPFQRAQQLLREMAGLAFRLTELAGTKIWAGGHNKAGGVQFLPGATLPPQGMAAGTTRDVLAVMEAHQALLLSAVGELQQIQQMDEEQHRVADGLAAHSASMRALARGLRNAHQVLEAGLERHQEHRGLQKRRRRTGLDGLGSGTLDVSDLVAYSHRISYTTFAPPEFADGQTPLRNALPPAPQEEQMRASQLYLFSDMDVGLPKPPPPKASRLLDAVEVEVPGLGMAAPPPMPPPGWKPGMPVDIPPGWKPGMPVDIPPGWKPGMPVDIPQDWKPGQPLSLPEGLDFLNVPQGWKPGDAVVLPPELQVPQRAALPPPSEILLKARDQPPPPPPAAATIQVAHVQLDLNPELEDDDYGSEYGSEDAASSDDDDDDE